MCAVARRPAHLADVAPEHRADEPLGERATERVAGVGGGSLAVVAAELALAAVADGAVADGPGGEKSISKVVSKQDCFKVFLYLAADEDHPAAPVTGLTGGKDGG